MQRETGSDVPSVPDTFDVLRGTWSILLEGVDFIADLERDDIAVDEGIVGGGLCDGGETVSVRETGVATGGGEGVDGVAVNDEGQGLPHGRCTGRRRDGSGVTHVIPN